MIYIRFHFASGRYHATPWGCHVNEGAVDWPPSPWRILRAMLSVGFTHLQWKKTVPDEAVDLIKTLSGCHPDYAMPPSVQTHTRHYMPVHEGSKVNTAKVLDTCVRVTEGQFLWLRFDVELNPSQYELLDMLVAHLGYLGRAESWVDAESSKHCDDELEWIQPADGTVTSIGTRLVRVLSTVEDANYVQWRKNEVAKATQRETETRGKKLTAAQRRNLEQAFPDDVTMCLLTDTATLQKAGWSQPPGSRWVDYAIPNSAASARITAKPRAHHTSADRIPVAALLALSSESVRGRALPHRSVALFVGEAIHKTCITTLGRPDAGDPELVVFTGRDGRGEFISGHRHAHFIPLCLGDRNHIDHVLVHAPTGFGPRAQQAIADVEKIYTAGLPTTFVTLLGFGHLQHVQTEIRSINRASSGIFKSSSTYRSVTPFVASRHLRRKYRLPENIADECRFRNLPEPIRVRANERNKGRFRLARIGTGRQPPQVEGWFVEIEFREPLDLNQLPLTQCNGSQLGLGLFAAIDAEETR